MNGRMLIITAVLTAVVACLAGCGTTTMDAITGQAKSIGHQTAGYSVPDTLTWNAANPPSHVTLSNGDFDVISPIQPSVLAVRVNPEGELPLDVFLSSSSDYSFESATFTRGPDGALLLAVEGFGADRSSVYNSVLVEVQKQLAVQVESGSLTQREALQVLGSVAEAVIAAAQVMTLP